MPPPVVGNINKTVPPRVVVTRPAVPLTATAHFTSTVSAVMTTVSAVNATGTGPGEISGPALELALTITNNSKSSVNLGNVVVSLIDSANEPGLIIGGGPAKPFSGSLVAEKSARGVYVFTVPKNRRSPITVSVSYIATAPVVVFVGSAA